MATTRTAPERRDATEDGGRDRIALGARDGARRIFHASDPVPTRAAAAG